MAKHRMPGMIGLGVIGLGVIGLGVIGLALLALAGCAARPASQAAAMGGDQPPTLRTGRIVSARHVVLRRAGAQRGVLGALGASAATATGAASLAGAATEFIVREQDGAIISVLQPDPTALHKGERVGILRRADTRLVPLAPAS